MTADWTASIRAAYDASAATWAEGAAGIYDRLSEVLVAAGPDPWEGARVLDLGAGTGCASRAVAALGATPIAVDLAPDMLGHHQRSRPPAVAGDALALPFRTGAFDAVVAAFSISHVTDPVRALAEAARVTRPQGVVLAAVFSARSGHPVKERVEAVAAGFGWRRPEWYERFKTDVEPLTAQPEALAATAQGVGLTEVQVWEQEVDLGPQRADELVAWRLSVPSVAPFVTSLPAADRRSLTTAARAALDPCPQSLRLLVLILFSRVPA